ncbi:MAG: hypothetical protein KKA62_00970 [Nanoarchaeota archaeon]|nr:hypothetical protein [Nanoarchaeota archaeon]MBU1644502.1 hypothetical protein [Nanoarchaeota archaeon]MBU1976506.1 hypothetical protein [Nanoarchaeota archaeon]
MKKAILIPILVLSLLLLTSCGESQQPTAKGAFIGGDKGVVAEFEAFGVEEESVYTIFDEETFPLEVTLRNNGEYEIKQGEITVKLLGPSQDEFSGIASWQLNNKGVLEAISEFIPQGGEETVSFASDAKYKSKVSGVSDREWFANVDYRYNTFLIIPEVCLKEDLTDERVCTVQEPKTYFVSGAPVTITGVEEETAGKGIMALKIKISNVGKGKVTLPGGEFGIRNQLSYTVDDPDWECKSGGKVGEAKLVEEEAEIICKLKEPLAKDSLSTKQIKLTFDYKYREIVQEKLRMKQSSN